MPEGKPEATSGEQEIYNIVATGETSRNPHAPGPANVIANEKRGVRLPSGGLTR